jgi:hypothetical protein
VPAADPQSLTRSLRLSFGLAWAAIAVFGIVLALLLGWRPFASDDDVIPFRRDAVDSDTALAQPLSDDLVKLALRVTDAPDEVMPGERLAFVVELRNPTESPIALDPCPALFTSFGESGTAAFEVSRLNCSDAPDTVQLGEAVRFRWEIEIPDTDDFHDGFEGSIYVALRGAAGAVDASGPDVRVSA